MKTSLEVRPRVIKTELEYLRDVLEEREEGLKICYDNLIRKAIHNSATCDQGGKDLGLEDKLLDLWVKAGMKGLWFACSKFRFYRSPHLSRELRKPPVIEVSEELQIIKGLRLRFESLLNGKRKGRLNSLSDMARDMLSRKGC